MSEVAQKLKISYERKAATLHSFFALKFHDGDEDLAKVEAIENGAVSYGEDNKNKLTNSCIIDGSTKTSCQSVKVQYLIDRNYVPTDELDSNGNEVIINDTIGDTAYANDMDVYIYVENNIVYAKLME